MIRQQNVHLCVKLHFDQFPNLWAWHLVVGSRTHTRTHTHAKTNTEAFCVSPSATDLPFVYSALPGYSL